MGWFSSLFTGGASELVDSVAGGIDSIFTSDEERLMWETKKLEVRAALETKLLELEGKVETYIQGQLTERHKSDMQSDSWLSKNIRPVTFIAVQLLFTLVVTLAYFGKSLSPDLVGYIVGILETIVMFYFGGRTIEKAAKMISGVLKKK